MVAIDAGTTGVRALAFDESGGVVDVEYRELSQHFPRPGWVEQDPDEIWEAARTTLAAVAGRLAERGEAVAAIGIANQRETALAWNRRTGRPLRRAVGWQDRRTTARCDELREAGHLPTVRSRTGLLLDPYFSATKYAWVLDDVARAGDVVEERTLALGTVDSWVLWQLTGGPSGGIFATDPSNASRTLLYDIVERRWSAELCDLFGVPARALADVRPSCGRFGELAPTALDGTLAGVPVSGLAGDQQAALFGQACYRPGLAKVTYGTGSFVLANVGTTAPPPPDGLVVTVAWDLGDRDRADRAGTAPAGAAGGFAYALEGSAFASGAVIQWLRDQLGVIASAEELGPLAESVPDAGGVTLVPAFAGLGSPWWDPRARGTITGITRGSGRAQLARAVVEAIAFEVRDMVDAMAVAGQPCSHLRADGGASAMDLLLQLQADQVGVPVSRPRSIETTALGAAMLAGLAEGVWGSLDELANLWQIGTERRPTTDRVSADQAYAGWLRAVDRSRSWAPG